MKIKFFSDFCISKICKEKYESICKYNLIKNYGDNKEIFITCDEDYTHAIILNKAMPLLKIPKENVLGFAFEPYEFLQLTSEFITYAKKYIYRYFIGDLNDLKLPFVEHHGYLWFSHPTKEIINKKKIMSIVFSEKIITKNHQYRHVLVKNILNQNLPIDIFGRGCEFLNKNSKNIYIKGLFKDTEPYEDYLFTISIENFKSNNYFSEKIITPVMCNTIPIYLGCKNINKYFGDYNILLSGILIDDIKLIINILQNPTRYINKVTTKKEIIFDNINLLKNITSHYFQPEI
jgi:hypothetical protein